MAPEEAATTIIAKGDIGVRMQQWNSPCTQLTLLDDEQYDRQPQRRRYEEPLSVRVRKQLLAIAESPLKRVEDEMQSIAKTICENPEDEELRDTFYELALQLVVEQPFKIPFVAAVVLAINSLSTAVVEEVLRRTAEKTNNAVARGEWRELKLLMKFLGSLQGLLDGAGVWSILSDLQAKAMDLQTENEDDVGTVDCWLRASADIELTDNRAGAGQNCVVHYSLYHGFISTLR